MVNASSSGRLSAMTGLAAVVLWAAGVLVIGGGHLAFPGGIPEEAAPDVLAFYVANADRVTAGSWAFMLGGLCFIWFTARVAAAVGAPATAGGTDSGARLASTAGAMTGALLVLSGAAGLTTALAAENLEAATAQSLDGVGAVFFIGAEMTGVVLFAMLAAVARRTGALPGAWSTASLALAVWLAVLPVGWVGLIVGVPVWTLATAALLGARESRRQASGVANDDLPKRAMSGADR